MKNPINLLYKVILIAALALLSSVDGIAQCTSSVDLSLNGGGNSITVTPNTNIDVTGNLEVFNFTSCPTCIRQLVFGIEGDAIACLYNGIPNVCPSSSVGTISGVSFTAPATPGVYNLYYNSSLEFDCNLARYAGAGGSLIGTVTVTDCNSEVNLSLNGGGNTLTVEPGANIDVTGNLEVFNYASCPTCIRQLVFGIEGDAIACLYDGIPNVCPSSSVGTISGVSFTAPATPGVYNLYYNSSLEFECNLARYAGTAGSLIGTVTVADCNAEVNLSLNGGGNTLTVAPGANIDVTGDLEVFNFASCPTCIRQLVLGIEEDAIGCLYDGIPNVCPSSSVGTIGGVSFTAPTTAGVYNLYYNSSLEFSCNPARYAGTAGRFIGTVTVEDETTSLDEENVQSRVVLYPNPSHSGQVNLALYHSQSDKVLLNIFDLMGKEVFSQTLAGKPGEQVVALDLAHLQTGIYVVQVMNGSEMSSHRLMLE